MVFCLLNFCFSCLAPRFSPALATKTDVLTCFTTFLLGAPSARVRSISLRVKGKLALLVGQADRSTLRVCASSATLTEPSARVRSLSLRVKGKLALLVGQADRSTLRVCASSPVATEPSARVRFRPLFPNKKAPERELFYLERVKGIEPSYSAWEAAALPLSYTREVCFIVQSRR